jgi:hypothetical protein
VADFGMAKKMYYEENYEKRGKVIKINLKNSIIPQSYILLNVRG